MFFSALIVASIACQIDVGGPNAPGNPIPVQGDEADALAQRWKHVIENAGENGEIMIIIDEAQMTCFIQQRIAENENPVIQNPQVFLRDGTIQVFGTTEQSILSAQVLLSIEPVLNENGELVFNILNADIGPLPIPDLLTATMATMLTEALTGTLGSYATGIKITSIAISEGELALVGFISLR